MKYIMSTAVCLSLSVVLIAPLSAQQGQWVNIGPGGGTITSIIEDNSDSSLLYMTIRSSGFYTSSNAGMSWGRKETGLPLSEINNVVQDPDEPLRLYLGTGRGVYRSIDRGESWTLASGTEMDTTLSFLISIDPILPSRLFAAGMGNGVFRSTDFGMAWTRVSGGLPPLNYVDITVDPNVNTRVYVSSEQTGIFRTITSGDFWDQKIDGLDNINLRSFLAIPTTIDLLFTGTTNGGFFRSTSAGDLWAQAGTNLPPSDISALAYLDTDPAMILAGTDGRGLYASTDNGDSFAAFSPLLSHHRISSLFTSSENTIYAGMEKDGLFISRDRGQTWSYSHRGLSGGNITAMTLSPENPPRFYAGLSDGENDLLVSTDNGQNWVLRQTGLPIFTGIYGFWLVPSAGTVFACTDSGVFITSDHGSSWSPRNSGLAVLTSGIAGSPLDENLLFVVSDGIFRSTNGGASWVSAQSGVEGAPLSILVSPMSPDTVYTGTKPNGNVGGGVYRSTDGGDSWEAINNGLELNESVFALTADPGDPQILFAATASGVFRTSNGGQSWSPLRPGLPPNFSASDILIDSSDPARILTSSLEDGVFMSTNSGELWSGLNTGLDTLAVLELEQNPDGPDTIYAATSGRGIYMIDLTPAGIEENAGESRIPRSLSLEQNFPNPFNPSTTITITIGSPQEGDQSQREKISLRIYGMRGKAVKTLFDGALRPGSYNFNWDGKDGNGMPAATGPYFLVLKRGDETIKRKMSLIR